MALAEIHVWSDMACWLGVLGTLELFAIGRPDGGGGASKKSPRFDLAGTSWEAHGEAKLKRRVRVDDAWVSAGKFTSPVSFGLRFDPSGEFLMEDAGGQVSVKGHWAQAKSKVKFELDAAAPPGRAQTVFGGVPVGAADGTMEVDAWKLTGSIENADDGTPALVWKQKFWFTLDRPDSAVQEKGKEQR